MVVRVFLGLLFLSSVGSSQKLTVSDIIHSTELRSQLLSDVCWLPGGGAFTFTKKSETSIELWMCKTKTGKFQRLFNSETLHIEPSRKEKRHILPNYQWSPDGLHLLIPLENDLFLFSIKSKTSRQLTHDNTKERDPSFSPDGKKISYLKNDNLMLYDLETDQEIELVANKNKLHLIGRFDWTYEEEFSIRTGFEWSPTSQHISFFVVDVTPVPEFPIVNFSTFQNSVEMMRYAKAGDPNAQVKIGVVDINTKKTAWMDCIGHSDSSYISRMSWFPKGDELALTWLNRRQNHLKLIAADINSGRTLTLLEEKSFTGWLEPGRKPMFISENEFVWLSEENGFNHIYRYSARTGIKKQLSAGDWDVNKIIHVDKKFVYFTAYKENSTDLDFYRIDIDGAEMTKLSQNSGNHSINMSPDGRHYLDAFSNFRSPSALGLFCANGKLVANLTTPPQKAIDIMQEIDFESIKIPLLGRTLEAVLMKPVDFDPAKSHPLLIYGYGGPNSHLVCNSWRHPRTLWHSMLVENGYLVLFLDSRGSGDQGVAWKHSVYKHLGDYEIQDHIDAARWAGELPYIDKKRIGIWGWSYGGYTTIMSLLKGGDTFKAGVAVAPVTDWRHYDSIYTERHMDLPATNASGYEVGSTLNFAEQLYGRLLLIHGSSDYNVHMSNTMQFAHQLQRLGKDFDLMIYPDKTHGLLGAATRVHVYDKIYRFILENL